MRGGRGGEIRVLNTGIQDVENSTKVRGGRGGDIGVLNTRIQDVENSTRVMEGRGLGYWCI